MHEPGEKPKVYGKVKAFVRDNADPEKRGRIRCFCPQVMGPIDDTAHWTPWALPCFPWLGGLNTLDLGPPYTKVQNGGVEVGVWLEFEGGDTDFPIWTGTWIPVPTTTDANAQLDLTKAGGQTGGDLIDNPPVGSTLGDLNPPKPLPTGKEVRLMAKAGREICIGVQGGGYILLGAYGVSLVGVQILENGRAIVATQAQKVFG